MQFNEEFLSFTQELNCNDSILFQSHPSWSSAATVRFTDRNVRYDIISVGDQLCEMTAAIRLSTNYSHLVRHTKLLMIPDLCGDQFASITPEDFVKVGSLLNAIFNM